MACGRVLWAAMVLTWVFLLTGKGLTVALPDHFYYGRPTVHEQDLHSPDGGAEEAEHSTTKRPRSNNQDLGDQKPRQNYRSRGMTWPALPPSEKSPRPPES
ncbi:hypothetical protein O3P69_010029 [Scylla paramamosain]|uniref:Uncharacterized protein n=1 Tax=Scylla paramamosain TaxID=85552 RepID=A0AAW0SNZ3_SCYPA